jgi:aquaporin Z
MFGRHKIATLVAEFLGTGILTLLVLSVKTSNLGVPFFIALAAGLTVVLMTFAFVDVSGANFNPALTIGLWTARKISTVKAVLYIVVQLLGAWAAYGIFTYLVSSTLPATKSTFSSHLLVSEALGTAILALGWTAAVYHGLSRAVSASMAGLAYVVGMVAVSEVAVGLLNPALALGTRSFVLTTYVLGPIIGAVVGVNLYTLLFAPSEALVVSAGASVASVAAVKSSPVVSSKAKTVTKVPAKRATRSKKTTA